MEGLVVYVDEKVETVLEDKACQAEPVQRMAKVTADEFKSALLQVGFSVVVNPKQRRDMVVRLKIIAVGCDSGDGKISSYGGRPQYKLDLSFENRGRLVFEHAWAGSEWRDDGHEDVLRGLVMADSLRRFASGPHEPDNLGEDGVVTNAPAAQIRKPTPTPPPSAAMNFVQGAAQNSAFALIIGVTAYRDVPGADGSKQDAERFASLARITLGIPEDHIRLAYDERATRSDLEKHFAWLKQNVPEGGRIYFAFSGHGAPNPSSGTPYLLPFDGDPKDLDRTAIPLTSIVDSLAETRAAEVLVLLDSCFSGAGGRSVLAPGSRPLVNVKSVDPRARVAVFSAATDAEISGTAPNNSGGLFSYVLAQALGRGEADVDGDGDISLEELTAWVTPRVTRQARKDSREQTPRLILGSNLQAGKFIVARGLATQ
jgi:hypothetical protein